jgi:ATP-dependent Clp protease ATP-binding subunit ClpA
MQNEVERVLSTLPRGRGAAYLSTRLLDLLGRAERDADRERAREVSVEHLLGALAQEIRGPAGDILSGQGIGPGSLKPHLAALRSFSRDAPFRDGEAAKAVRLVRARAPSADPVIGRDAYRRHHPRAAACIPCWSVSRASESVQSTRVVAAYRLATARLLEVDIGALASGAR